MCTASLPFPATDITEFEARRAQLENQASVAILTGRASLLQRIGHRIFARTYVRRPVNRYLPQPSMRWFDGPRVQPRAGNGRFLSKAWLADAELFLPADRAWFRSPIATEAV